MEDFGLHCQIAVVSMISTLLKNASAVYTRNTDPGRTTELTKMHRLVREEEGPFKSGVAIPWATPTVLFDGIHYEGDVKLLHENTPYRSSVSHHLAVLYGQCYIADHQQRKVWFFRSTCRDVKDHQFTLSDVRNVMDKLHMLTDTGKEYKLVLVIFTDWSRLVTHGTKFDPTLRDSESISTKGCVPTGSESPSPEDQAVVPRLSTLIVRHCYYPQRPKVKLRKK